MDWEILIVIILLIINYPVYKLLYRLFFYDADEFDESVRYSFTPNFISFFRGEYWEDKMSTFKLQMYIFSCIIIIFLEFILFNKIIGYL
ncbi:hypothetical protein GC093_13425 [Paenibacillus sp. LMG 31456]|uniref:Uncharacterized protein n=1 Tax=Paenibacillus foliorum TaxID=2654974 RepID=A0A972K0V7_9BACL|nr:hypothetical protein [Paenibacillus foliorum]